MARPSVYLDYNATAPVRPEAAEALQRALMAGGNPSSVHAAGRAAKATLETAREGLAAALGARAQDIVFTSGATEALHLALDGAREAFPRRIVSSIEHDAVAEYDATAERIACRPDGLIDLEDLERKLKGAPATLVVLMLANNETGAIQPVAQAAPLVRQHGGALLVDAVQAFGRMPVDLQALDATYLVVSSHKIGGPPGAGALALAPGAPLASPRRGGGQERGARPGTENTPAIAGFAAAVAAPVEDGRLRALRDRFEAGLRAWRSDAVVFADGAPRLANTSLFALPNLAAETALIGLDLEGVALSSGAACSSGKVRGSRVLAAMGAPRPLASCALRASFGWASGEEDVDRLLAALVKIDARRRERGAA